MKKVILIAIIIFTAFFAVSILSSVAANAKTMPKNAKSIALGKKLFYSRNIGTDGFSCATCHVYSAGTYAILHGRGMVIMPLKNAAKSIAAFDKMHHMHITVPVKIKMCVKYSLKGHISGKDLKALTAYVDSLR